MRELFAYDYAVVRVVPRVERGECINIGVIVSCPARDYLQARIEIDEPRLQALDATLDLEAIRRHAASIPAICDGGDSAGPIGRLTQRERFHWLVAPRSTIIQLSPVHTGRCSDPALVLDQLLDKLVRPVHLVDSR
jgi:Protein of unknown function (DUF3037)